MGCVGCKKANAKRGASVYITCPICDTVLHGRKKDMPKINDHLVCGQCYKKYKAIKKLEKAKPKKEKGNIEKQKKEV